MNKKGTLLLVLILGISLFGGSIVKATVKQTPTEFAIVFATGGLGDKSFNDAAYRGMEQAIAKYGSDINVDYVEPQTIDEFATYQDDLAKLGKYELIICVGFLQTSALNVSADTYTGTDWLLIDAVLDKPNVQSITFKEHEGSFLVGAMAGMVTATNKIGFLGGLDIYLINKFRAGYEQGAKYINPDIKITSVYSPDPTNPWGDIPGGKETGQNLYSQGNDVVYAAAGGTGIGVMQAANETADVYAIGVDSDQDYLAKGKVLCSMLKLVETAVFTSIDGKMQDTWTATHKELGLKEDGVGISPMNFTQSIKNGNFEINGTTKTRWEWIQDIKAKIISGEIVVSDTPEPDVTPVPGFEGSTVIFIVVLLGFAASHIRKRR